MDGFFPSLEVFSIKASSLERLCFYCNFTREKDLTLVVHESLNLRTLEFRSDYVTEEWFCRFLPKFPLQESLTLTRCSSRKRLWILNPLLKKIVTEDCNNLNDIRIETPELSSFYYEGNCSIHNMTQPSIWTQSPPKSRAVGFSFSFFKDPSGPWFHELQKVLPGWSATFRCFRITCASL